MRFLVRSYLVATIFASGSFIHAMVPNADPFFYTWIQSGNPYRKTVAKVKSSDLSDAEKNFLQNRSVVVKQAVETIVSQSITVNQVPRIAVAGSGGGYRAMISLIGALEGLQNNGLLDAITYLGGVSGGTWCIMPWVASGESITNFKLDLFPTLAQGLLNITAARDVNNVAITLLAKWVLKQPVGLVDLYGATLANNLLLDNKLMRLGQDLSPLVADGSYPLPIGCALGGNDVQSYRWFEFSPFEIGSTELNAYIPTWALGRAFNKGTSTDFAPEQNLGFFLGTFGSAFAETCYKDAYKILVAKLLAKNQTVLSQVVKNMMNDYQCKKDIGGGVVNNFMLGLPSNPFAQIQQLSFIDAGITFHAATGIGSDIPLLPFLRDGRAIDILIIFDASDDLDGAPELNNAVSYAKKLGYPMPDINYAQASKQAITIFKNPNNTKVPVIIYMPNIQNNSYSLTFDPRACAAQGYCSSANFAYTQAQAQELSGLVTYNVTQNKDVIYQTIRDVVARKS
jgi:phospholipase A2